MGRQGSTRFLAFDGPRHCRAVAAVALLAGCTTGTVTAGGDDDDRAPIDAGAVGDGGADGESDGGATATCGSNLLPPAAGQLAQPVFSVERGFFDDPFDVTITQQESAIVVYTLDGSEPGAGNGTEAAPPVTLPIAHSTVLRARAFAGEQTPSRTTTATYLRIEDVLDQPASVEGYPQLVHQAWHGGTQTLDYEMDPEIVNADRAQLRASLTAIPSMSITMDRGDLFGPDGIYDKGGSGKNRDWQRAASVELIVPGDPSRQLQVDAAIRPHTHVQVKRSFKLLFKAEYGVGKLSTCLFRDAPLNGDSAALRVNSIILRGGTNRSLHEWCHPDDSTYIEDQWMHDAQIAMSGVGSHGAYVHLYLNGLYFGLYNAMERPDDAFAAAYLGGDDTDWFAINHGGPVDGDPARWEYLTQTLIGRDMSIAENYAELQEYLDVASFIDYLLLNWYAGTTDWPGNNWYGANRNTPPGPFRFFIWDADEVWDGRCQGPGDPPPDHFGAWVMPDFVAGSNGNGKTIAKLWHAARRNPDFMALFVERANAHLFEGGALTEAASLDRWDRLAAYVEGPFLAETARWGDARAEIGERKRTRDNMWYPTVERMRNARIPGNVARFIEALQREGYYP